MAMEHLGSAPGFPLAEAAGLPSLHHVIGEATLRDNEGKQLRVTIGQHVACSCLYFFVEGKDQPRRMFVVKMNDIFGAAMSLIADKMFGRGPRYELDAVDEDTAFVRKDGHSVARVDRSWVPCGPDIPLPDDEWQKLLKAVAYGIARGPVSQEPLKETPPTVKDGDQC